MQRPFSALYLPANPHVYPSKVQLVGYDDPRVVELLAGHPGSPAIYDRDAAYLLRSDRLFVGEPLNERATAWMRDHSDARGSFRDELESEYFMSGNVLVVGYSRDGGEAVFSDVPDRHVDFAMSRDHDEVVDAHRARLVRMRSERRDLRLVGRLDPASRAAEERAATVRERTSEQVQRGEIEL